MRLITHNMLKCNVKGVENGYPLEIQAEEVEEVEGSIESVSSRVVHVGEQLNTKKLQSVGGALL